MDPKTALIYVLTGVQLLVGCMALMAAAPTLAATFRRRVRDLLESSDRTQRALAAHLRVDASHVSRMLKFDAVAATTPIDRVEAVADFFGVPTVDVIRDPEDAPLALATNERDLIELFRLLPETQRGNLLAMLTYIFEPRRAANAERRALALLRASMARTLAEPPSRSSKRLG